MDYEKLGKWLAKRAEEANATDPELEHLKQRVRIATAAVIVAEGDAVAPALQAQTSVNWALVQYLASKRA
jgi:hypothetical protein